MIYEYNIIFIFITDPVLMKFSCSFKFKIHYFQLLLKTAKKCLPKFSS